MKPHSNTRVLELGCGTGDLAFDLASIISGEVIGTDISPSFIAEANRTHQRENLKFVAADLRESDIEKRLGGKFHYIVGNGILHHLYAQLDDFLPRMRRLLEPSGKIVFWEPNILNPYVFAIFSIGPLRKVAKLDPEEMAFGSGFIRAALEKAGFSAISVKHKDFLLPNTPESLIPLVVRMGDILEETPVLSLSAQSLFIAAENSP